MHNPFDHLAKTVGKEALDTSGATAVEHPISRDAQRADLRHDPDPARFAERARLGLLGRLAEVLCLIEVYGHAPGGPEIRACLSKHFTHWEHCERQARRKRRKDPSVSPEPVAPPFLWILAATVSAPVLQKLGARPAQSFPPGVHLVGDDLLRVGIVVASELPRDRSTVLLRLMAAGPGLAAAVAELGALPEDAPERAMAEGIVVHLQDVLGKKPDRTPEEEEFIVTVHTTWAEARKLGRDEGRDEGRADARAHAVLTVLRARGITVPDAARERILAQKDPEGLERWLERAAVVPAVDDVFDEPS
jgi:hypothetical protein